MQPTWYGEIMIRHARRVRSTLSRAHDEITALKSGLTGQINLGAIMGRCTTLVPRTIIAMKQRFPRVQLNVSIETSNVLQQRLQQGRLDLLVARLFETHDKSRLNDEELSREPLALVARPGHPLRDAAWLTLRDLTSSAWILPITLDCEMDAFGIITRQDAPLPPAVESFLDLLRELSRELYGSAPAGAGGLLQASAAP